MPIFISFVFVNLHPITIFVTLNFDMYLEMKHHDKVNTLYYAFWEVKYFSNSEFKKQIKMKCHDKVIKVNTFY